MTICPKHITEVLPGKDCEECIQEEEFTTCVKHGTVVELFVDCPDCMQEENEKEG